uniref:Periplasmic thiol:disulfide interchange protein DsbA n=1 Tax=uncultured Thiotrichaceae bacterium TaxID=298394 RepID=A0A6S6TYT2_9GAMM|nr:MAG: Periplasmic thiol:disulfide interchange protein DsbA [uncultured Thiotrichaceae bacterium]
MKITVKSFKRIALGVAFALMSSSQVAIAEDAALFQLDEKGYTSTDLPLSVQQALYDAQLTFYKTRAALVDEALVTLEVEKQAKESGKSVDETAAALFKAEEASEEEINKFYEENKARINQPLDKIKGQVKQLLEQNAQVARQGEFLEKLKENSIFKLGFDMPVAPFAEIDTSGFPSKGAADGKVVLVDFADYQCPHCARAAEVLSKVGEQFKDDLKIVYMDFPINRSGVSRKIAEGAACAGKQDKFWEYHDLAFSDQRALNDKAMVGLAEKLKLDMDEFNKCIESDYPEAHVKRAQAEGARLGVNSTPTLFLNGRRLHLHNMEKDLPGEIEKALAAAK